jgi:hypothetical protein
MVEEERKGKADNRTSETYAEKEMERLKTSK